MSDLTVPLPEGSAIARTTIRTERKGDKHQYAIEYGIRFNTIKEVEHLPEEVRGKRDTAAVETNYENESIRSLNDIEKAEIEAEVYRTQLLTYQEDEYSF